jgi:uncharacterized protein YeaO (DUF488 family)
MLGDDALGDCVHGTDEGGVIPGGHREPEAPVQRGHAVGSAGDAVTGASSGGGQSIRVRKAAAAGVGCVTGGGSGMTDGRREAVIAPGKAVALRRAYDPPARGDGRRILVDRVWPRGVRREEASIDEWARDVAPSDELRRWFGHDPERWDEFRRRYRAELRDPGRRAAVAEIARWAGTGPVTLVYGARDRERNQAVVLAEVVSEELAAARERGEGRGADRHDGGRQAG